MYILGTVCGADFYNSSIEKADSPGDPSDAEPGTPGSERRKSGRVRRDKPDYYDALDFDTKRGGKFDKITTPTRPKRLASDKIPYKLPKFREDGHKGAHRGRPRKHPQGSSSRATLTWKTSRRHDDYDDEIRDKKKKKRKHHKENKDLTNIKEGSRDSMNDPEEEMTTAMDELPPEKTLQCKVSLAEINRKLGVVMCQPVW